MDSRHNSNPIFGGSILTAWLTSATLFIGLAGTSSAQTPAATLLTPRPTSPASIVVRGAEPTATDAAATSDAPAERNNSTPPDMKYPPPYSSQRSKTFPLLGTAWKKMIGDSPTPKTTVPPAPADVRSTPESSAVAPAWRWYGYGAPVSNQNRYAPQGFYAPVAANWYTQSGATPGAIPQSAEMLAQSGSNPVMPIPTAIEPAIAPQPIAAQPKPMIPADIHEPSLNPPARSKLILPPEEDTSISLPPQNQPDPVKQETAPIKAVLGLPEAFKESAEKQSAPAGLNSEPGATLDGRIRPVQKQEKSEPDLILPDMSESKTKTNTVSRAQAPTPVNSAAPLILISEIEALCAGQVLSVDIQSAGARALIIRIEARNQLEAQAIANRIAAIKGLASYHVVYQAVVR